jgi:signal transduction histidine kinase
MQIEVNEEEEMVFKKIRGDSNRFEQIIINFLSNAVKFTNFDGNIKVKLVLHSLSKYEEI